MANKQPTRLKSMAELFDKIAGKGLIPPQVLEIEQSVLGACMLDKLAIGKVTELIGNRTYEDSPFYRDAHTSIYQAMCTLFTKGEPVDLGTTANQLRSDGKLEEAGGLHYLVELTSNVVSSANIDAHARIILEKWMLREVIRSSEETKLRAFNQEDDVFALLQEAETVYSNLLERRFAKSMQSLPQISAEVKQDIHDYRSGVRRAMGLSTGLDDLDGVIGGLEPGTLTVIAARPSQGKTALLLYLARCASLFFDTPSGIFSLEMAAKELVQRMLASHMGVNFRALQEGQFSDEQIANALDELSSMKLFIDDTPSITPLELKAKARRLVAREKVGVIFVDYLQLMDPGIKSDTRDRELGYITGQLKSLAKELRVPIVLLCQLSRKVEERGSKEPQLSDLRESGSIEQDADKVIFIWQPYKYKLKQTPRGNNPVLEEVDGKAKRVIAVLTIAKQRNGPIGLVEVCFEGETQRFMNISSMGAAYGVEDFK